MQPSKKSPEMETFIDLTLHKMKGRTRTGSIHAGICAWCGKEVGEFRDEESRKEYTISGFCQKCQDETFGK